MTQRERQILQWIEADPMISQEKLAELAGITRSSVAVHISNLMKKGYIAGKGYVLRSGSYAAVVGGVNIDIGGRSLAPLVPKDSNPGKVTMSLGGVGRNIAHNMSLLGVDVRFLTAFGDDIYAQRIAASCGELGIDISHALQVPGGATPTYLFLNDSDGDMALAMSDMEICERITPKYLAANLQLLNNAQLVVTDTNIPEQSLAYLAEHCTAPIFADPVSTAKAGKLKPILGKLHTIKPNRIEAELLSGVKITDENSLREAARTLLATGLHRVFISLGTDGVFAADQKEMRLQPCFRAEMKNATGAGDAFMAALAWAYLEGTDLAQTAKAAAAAAAIAVEGSETINPVLSAETVRRRMDGSK
ncbi:MAG: bifunctional hydroxymethylpyrimidine kinase/phosphomethylpyrimidine kinase [Oscillospiraceae bacterium]|nr:bifunctional hydroxymethylpyrimidine kinase/phosphomethylpyrimidine kinase [Oscillospiraceae bacterium]